MCYTGTEQLCPQVQQSADGDAKATTQGGRYVSCSVLYRAVAEQVVEEVSLTSQVWGSDGELKEGRARFSLRAYRCGIQAMVGVYLSVGES